MDLIDKEAALDAMGERPLVWTGGDYELGCRNQYDADRLAIETVPPAQLAAKDTNALNNDCISRQAAIEVADAIWSVTGDKNVAKVWDQIKDLPSAQPKNINCCQCKYWKPGYITDDDDFVPPGCTVGWVAGVWYATDYCSNAERRQDETD